MWAEVREILFAVLEANKDAVAADLAGVFDVASRLYLCSVR